MTFARRGKGFTILELMVVLIAVAILMVIAAPIFSGNVDKAREAALKGILGNLRTAIAQYRVTFDNNPSSVDLSTVGEVIENEMPTNPFNDLNTIEAATQSQAYSSPRDVDGSTGWRYYDGSLGDPPVLYANTSKTVASDGGCACDL